ncbi:MAG: NAD(P)H-hydrate dehydratase, partial [Chitinophagales bacterium]
LFADQASQGVVIQADKTISFQAPKLAFLFPENELYVGDWQIVDIGLHPDYLASVESNYHYLTNEMVEAYLQPKSKFHHKGKNGHALVIGGSYGKMGAAILTAKATLKAGAGLVTAYVPECGYQIMQIALPEAMCLTDTDENFISFIPNDLEKYATIAIGPGLGQAPQTEEMLGELIPEFTRPMVVDADALNIIAKNDWARHLPKNSILTPHPKEFERLVGKSSNSFERLQRLRVMALQNGIFIVLKGAHTCIACPDGTCYFNSTGSPAMATAGSGDVLTGMIAAFLSQGYSPKQAALLGVFYHGQAGDKAAEAEGNILAGDLIRYFRI